MNRVALMVVVLGMLSAGAVFFVLTPGEPDAPADGAAADGSAVTARSPRPDSSGARDSAPPPPAAPEPAETPARARSGRAAPDATAAPAPPAAPTTATLRIVSDVPGAQVFLNREFVGSTPATAADLKPGEYQLNVSAPGYENHVETLQVTPGDREVTIAFRVVRLDATLDVVHKHRFGSCKGRLMATPRGIRYDTTDKDDVFQSALLDLETFQVDYLNKNLRIQPRKGKRYDFTDPEGNADRLFVFHRDVERARERLQKGDAPAVPQEHP